MKQLYSLTTFAIALSLFTQTSFAQTYDGGTFRTVQSGNWKNNSPTPVWEQVAPQPVCHNCHIIITDGQSITLNTDITLTGNSLLEIGTPGSTQHTHLVIPFSSSATSPTPFPIPSAYNRINMVYMDAVTIAVNNGNSSIDAGTTGPNDGIFMAVTTNGQGLNAYSYISRVGTSALFNGSTVIGGPSTLNSTGTLPIILSGFDARMNNGQVDLTWSTQQESNSDHIAVLRSTDGGAHWPVIGTVAAHGSSSTTLHYSFTDTKPGAGTNQYRLQLVDRDGEYAYSDIKTVRNGLITSVGIYPNPARDYVNVTLGGNASLDATIRLLNQTGQLLLEKTVTNAGGTTVSLAVGSYPQGNYLIVVIGADGSKQVSKLLITK